MSAQITTTTGTFTQPIVKARREGGSTVVLGDIPHIVILTGAMTGPAAIGLGAGNMNMDSQLGIYTDQNMYQEFNSYIQWVCANTGQDGRSAVQQVSFMCADYLRNPEMRRIYAP